MILDILHVLVLVGIQLLFVIQFLGLVHVCETL